MEILLNKRGVCLIRFDDHMGPSCIYSEGLDDKFAEKVSMKSHISTLSLTSGTEFSQDDFVESVIPFLDEGYVAYSTFFFVNDETARGGKRTLGIVALVDRSEQMSLFKSIPNISTSVKDIASEFLTKGDPKDRLPEQIKFRLNSLLQLESLDISRVDLTDSTALIKQRIESTHSSSFTEYKELQKEPIKGDFEFVLRKLPTCCDRIIHALLKNERVLVIGTQEEIKLTISTFREFLPHKKTFNDLYSVPILDAQALFSKTANDSTLHILGIVDEVFYDIIDESLYPRSETTLDYCVEDMMESLQELPISSKIVIDYTQGKVFGGVTNNFCNKILESIVGVSFTRAKELINGQINHLIERVNELTNLFLFDFPTKEQVELFLWNSSDGEVSLIVSIIDDINPQLLSRIIRYFSENQLALEVLF